MSDDRDDTNDTDENEEAENHSKPGKKPMRHENIEIDGKALTEEDLTLLGESSADDDDYSEDENEDDPSDHVNLAALARQAPDTLVTKEGLKKLKDELDNLENIRRREVANRLKEAISYGDLSENSEYEEAKNEQAFVEGRILELQEMIKNAKIISEKSGGKSKVVKIGSTVTVQNITEKDEPETYTIVGSTETDPIESKISNESPIGSAVLDREEGDVVQVRAPAGDFQYKILKVR